MSTNIFTQPIKKREVFYTFLNDVMIFPGWARVITGLGTMFEPFEMGFSKTPNTGINDADPSDPMSRVEGLIGSDSSILDTIYSDVGCNLHGGTMVPRDFAKGGAFSR